MVNYRGIMFIVMLLITGNAFAAITAQVDRYAINVDESINLTIEVSGDDSGEPDTSPIQRDFEVLSRNQSSSYSLINGSMSSKAIWYLSLRPRHAGALIIPALAVGKKKTTPITIHVSKVATRQASGDTPKGNLWIDMSVQPKSVHVQQQAIITLRIFQAVALNRAQLSEPASDQAIIVRLGEDKNYQLKRDGRNWIVTERRYAIFAQHHGVLELKAVQLDGSIALNQSIYGSPFQTTKPVRIRSNAVALLVEAIPSDWKWTTWLPAKQVELSEDWPSGEIKVGDSITRTLTLKATGQTSSQLPEINTLLPEHLKAYPDKPVLKDSVLGADVQASRQQKLAILATREGTFILPGMDIDWWDSASQSMQTASLPPRTFKVLPAALAQPIAPQQAQLTSKAQSGKATPPDSRGWKWLALFSTLGWLLTLGWFLRKPRHRQPTTNKIPPDSNKLKQAVLQACAEHQAKPCARALLNMAEAQWPSANINSLSAMASHCDANLGAEIHTLERHIYADTAASWNPETLRQAFEDAAFTPPSKASVSKQTALPSLYPE